MFKWMGCDVELVSAADINGNRLGGFSAVCVPGGDMYQYSQDISFIGKANVRSFVSSGGAYIGICGGAYFASTSVVWRGTRLNMEPLRIFQGQAIGPEDAIAPYPDYSMCEVDLAAGSHPLASGDTMWVLYCWGPMLVPDPGAPVDVIGRYAIARQPAIVAFQYGEGRVFLIGVHPEIEEDSDRDSVSFGDELDDRGSEWDFMKTAVSWCLKRTL